MENLDTQTSHTSKFDFSADMEQLMQLIVHNFYSNRDIFLRELLSNASDAIDKARFNKLNNNIDTDNSTFEIKITMNKNENILVIEDNGIGMNRDDLLNNLGTIARSGTKNFMKNLEEEKKDVSLIGQFGVGFYSAFLVANKVIVTTQKLGESEAYRWESDGASTFTLENEDSSKLNASTRIELYLKDDAHNYLLEDEIKKIVNQHSQYISYPIKLLVTKSREVEQEEDDKEVELENTESDDVKVEDVTEGESEQDSKEKKTITEEYDEWEQLNEQESIWIKNPESVSDEEYKEFFTDFNKK